MLLHEARSEKAVLHPPGPLGCSPWVNWAFKSPAILRLSLRRGQWIAWAEPPDVGQLQLSSVWASQLGHTDRSSLHGTTVPTHTNYNCARDSEGECPAETSHVPGSQIMSTRNGCFMPLRVGLIICYVTVVTRNSIDSLNPHNNLAK